ncbi:MAG TPA: ATP-binding protein [Chloroflexia bacterium]|jgi:hypothetical protein
MATRAFSDTFTAEVAPAGETGKYKISPTDISQFIRLEQCQRYLRLRLHERAHGRGFFEEYGVHPQTIPPLLTRSGQSFEEQVEAQVSGSYPTRNFGKEGSSRRDSDNDAVVSAARDLPMGDSLVLFQVRLSLPLGEWWFRGDIDILRMRRDDEGALHLLIADMKSSAEAKMEHRLQVAFYHQMLSSLLEQNDVAHEQLSMGILYRGSLVAADDLSPQDLLRIEEQRRLAAAFFGVADAFLEVTIDPQPYVDSVKDLVTGTQSTARKIISAPIEELPYHLEHKCDGCLYNEFCMRWTAETSDLSLVPHLTALEKEALRHRGVGTVFDLAQLKELRFSSAGGRNHFEGLAPASGKEATARQLSGQWGVGHRLDELILRARRYLNWKQYPLDALPYIPSKGHGSLPHSAPDHNPNLVKIYVDAQHDYLQDRVYLLGSLVVAYEDGVEKEERSAVVRMTAGPPDTQEKERDLLVEWIEETLRAVVELAAPDAQGEPSAPIHIIFFNRYEQRVVLDALARHLPTILAATPMYDFLTQKAAFDSPIVTFLDDEIRELKNYPMLCQSLQAVSAFLKFNWRKPLDYRSIFRERMFDFWGKLDALPGAGVAVGEGQVGNGAGESNETDNIQTWYTNRARFKSEIPLEYAYSVWDELPLPADGKADPFEPYRKATADLILGFQVRRLEAMEYIVTHDFKGNHLTTKTAFRLPDLPNFSEKAPSLAHALDEFVTIERHVTLAGWKAVRNLAPERRVLMGETLLVRYREEDQDPEVAEKNREDERRWQLRRQYRAEFRDRNPNAKQVRLPAEQKAACEFSQVRTRYRLRLETAGVDTGLDEVLGLSNLREGEMVILYPRITYDERLPQEQRTPQTPTPKQLLYGPRVKIERILVERNDSGRATQVFVEVEWQEQIGGDWSQGFVFASASEDRPLVPGKLYTLDTDINDINGYWSKVVTTELCKAVDAGNAAANTLYSRLVTAGAADEPTEAVNWDAAAGEGQMRFYAGLEALHAVGEMPQFEESKQDYISAHGDDPVLLVQGPPGTGKSYSTAFAIFSRLQGAVSSGRDFRVFISCKTHAAIDVLLQNVKQVQERLRYYQAHYPDLFGRYFDPRLLEVDLFRIAPKQDMAGVINLEKERDKEKGEDCNADVVLRSSVCVVASTPGHVYQMIKTKWGKSGNKDLFGHYFCDLLVLDEASQMNIPEAIMAALPLKPSAQLIVVGDHRQMAPIIKHSWDSEPRRTFKEYKTYRSLFVTLLEQTQLPPMIKFSESFRLHSAMAEFLRREIYSKDGIPYHSNRHLVLPHLELADPFTAAVLAAEHPIVVIVHDEAHSQTRNTFEQRLVAPVLEALAGASYYGLDAREGLGVVVPHRAQRAEMQTRFPQLSEKDPATGAILISAVDTVERFQGGEREAVLYSATESDLDYLLAAGKFLYDPNRLTVAISRAKRKMILVASRSIFSLFSPDEQVFENAQLWKDLLRRTCTVKLWEGTREEQWVEVWGNENS